MSRVDFAGMGPWDWVASATFAVSFVLLALNWLVLRPSTLHRAPEFLKSRWWNFAPLAACVVAAAFEAGVRFQWMSSTVPEPATTWHPSSTVERNAERAEPPSPAIAVRPREKR
jgi:hypothetical protein